MTADMSAGRIGERVELKQRGDGQWYWTRVEGNNRKVATNGEGIEDKGHALSEALHRNPGVNVLHVDEQGGIVEEWRNPLPPTAGPGFEFRKGDTVSGPDGRAYRVVDITEPDADGRFRVELVNTEHFEETTNV